MAAGLADSSGFIAAIAWRNLWRNPRRTWLTSGGIAFACVLLLFSRSMQLGSYHDQIEATTALLSGHAQIQHIAYLDDPQLEYLVPSADALAVTLATHPGVAASTPRTSSFALLSVDERSVGAQIMGVVPNTEVLISTLPGSVVAGRYLHTGTEAVLGRLLAKNLGLNLGDEVVVLGTGPEGGVAALALKVVGLFETGLAALDRSVLQTPLATFQDGFYIADAASYIVLEFNDIDDSESILGEVKTMLSDGIVIRSWEELLPEVVQGIALDRISARLMYGIVTLIVLFSIVNTFIMTIFERTRELGMLLAIGMPPWRIIAMLQLEALWLAIIGGALGAICAAPLLAWLIFNGIPIEGMAEMTQGLVLPTHIKGSFAIGELIMIPLVFVFGCQIASIVPGSRVLRLRPVEALRAE